MKRLSFTAMALIFLAACSGPADEPAATTSPDSKQETEASEVEKEVTDDLSDEVTLKLSTTGETMTDMAFEPKRLTVSAGAEVTLILENKASSAAMIHNAVIIEAGKQEAVIEKSLAAGPDNNYVGDSEFIIAATEMANPGETVEVKFTAPSEAGTYQYICTYPGHAAMKGILMVK